MKKILPLLLILYFVIPVLGLNDQYIGTNSSTSYTTLVDHMHGFYRVYESNKSGDVLVENYQNRTLKINIGDTVVWSNDAVPDTELTIISQQNLWENITCGQYLCSDLRWNYKKFGYTFNKSGVYMIYIQQFPIFNQTIIVGQLLSNSNSMNNSSYTHKKDNDSDTTRPIPISSNTPNRVAKQNSILKTNSVSKVKSFSIGTDTIILTIVLLSMVILSGKIKDNDE